MASSSAISITENFKYDVFLSFRGEDTRTNFVDHLHHQLHQKGIHTYKDDERIRKGQKISDELIRSIEDSKFYIVVFSKNYASSSWCLDELVKIMECHKTMEHTAYPVFYDVEPSEVRKQKGAVGEAFAKHETEEAAGKWREALKDAADLAGWELKNTVDGHEAKLVRKIVVELSHKLCSITCNIDGKLVGMESRIHDIKSSLGTCFEDVRMIGIRGMGGGGKTTLARAVFDQISIQFEGKSFVENVREVSNASLSGLKSLQNQVLSDVLNDKDIKASSVYDGKHMMKRMMRNRKVLVVLDDVDHIDQLEALAGEPNWFKPGSRIIITTRDEQVLVAHRVKFIHDVTLLSDREAICLFSRYAFGRDFPAQGHEDLSRQIVCYASGLPLTIKVLGSFLCDKDELEWVDAIERLKTIPLAETLKKLELSYIGLEDDYKEIFLDVACIMKGWEKEIAITTLEICGYRARNGLRVLEQRSLITTYDNSDSHKCIGMHDHIEELGKNIVRRSHPDKPHKHSRLWKHEEIEDVFANDLGTKAIRCIRLYTMKLNPDIVVRGLGKMKELRFLSVDFRGHFSDTQTQYNLVSPDFPNALRYLYMNQYPFRSLPKTFQANNLVALKMAHSRIVQLWEGGEKKVLTKLRFLDLSCSMLSSLDLVLTPNLETLNLRRCTDLVELHMPHRCLNLTSLQLTYSKLRILYIRLTPNLEKIDLKNCYYLEEFHMAGECQKLVNLDISHSKLRTLDLGLTPNLETLDLKECRNLVELHTSNGCLKKLVHLNLSGCLRFESFLLDIKDYISCSLDESVEVGPITELHLVAESVQSCPFHPDNNLPKFQFNCLYEKDRHLTRNAEMLVSVGMCDCTNLETFSGCVCGLHCLRKLKVEGKFLEAPKYLDQLECLEEVIFRSTKINHLPDSICMVKHLKSLKLDNCLLLEKLPEDLGRLEFLEKLQLSYTEIKQLPDSICMLKHLKSLKLENCSLSEKLAHDLVQLEFLEELDLSITKIKHLPDSIIMLKHLKSLKLNNCLLLEKLPEDLGRLECLEKLQLSYIEIKQLPDSICMVKHLKSLKLDNCLLLEKLPEDLGRLECLENLQLSYTEIKQLPDSICMLKHLKSLKLNNCLLLEKLPEDLGRLECLEKLQLSYIEIKQLPDSICMLKHLKSLKLDNCLLLEKLPEDLGRLECLEKLQLSYTEIKQLPDSICMLKHLKSLKLENCSLLEKLPQDLGQLEFLESLCISTCRCLQDIPSSIGKMKCLKDFSLGYCSRVEKLPEELGHLKCLKLLDVRGTSIRCLPRNILLLKGLRIIGSRELLELCGFKSEIQTSECGTFCYVQIVLLLPNIFRIRVSSTILSGRS